MILCKGTPKIIFVHIPKTAGTSITKALTTHLNGYIRCGGKKSDWSYHTTALQFKSRLEDYDEYFKFTFVRNPWDRMYSWCSMMHQLKGKKEIVNKETFKRWLLKTEQRPQLDWIVDENSKSIVDYIGRYETLEDSYVEVCNIINLKCFKLPHLRSSIRFDYRDVYDDEMIEFVAERYKKDIETFGYSF